MGNTVCTTEKKKNTKLSDAELLYLKQQQLRLQMERQSVTGRINDPLLYSLNYASYPIERRFGGGLLYDDGAGNAAIYPTWAAQHQSIQDSQSPYINNTLGTGKKQKSDNDGSMQETEKSSILQKIEFESALNERIDTEINKLQAMRLGVGQIPQRPDQFNLNQNMKETMLIQNHYDLRRQRLLEQLKELEDQEWQEITDHQIYQRRCLQIQNQLRLQSHIESRLRMDYQQLQQIEAESQGSIPRIQSDDLGHYRSQNMIPSLVSPTNVKGKNQSFQFNSQKLMHNKKQHQQGFDTPQRLFSHKDDDLVVNLYGKREQADNQSSEHEIDNNSSIENKEFDFQDVNINQTQQQEQNQLEDFDQKSEGDRVNTEQSNDNDLSFRSAQDFEEPLQIQEQQPNQNQFSNQQSFTADQTEQLAKQIFKEYEELVTNNLTSEQALQRFLQTIQDFNKMTQGQLTNSDTQDQINDSFHSRQNQNNYSLLYDHRILNQWEQNQDYFPMDFKSPLSMKRYMDQWVRTGEDNGYKEWDTKKISALVKIWIKWSGSHIDSDYPIIRAEHYFPDVDDPRIILACINELKGEWDTTATAWDEQTQFRTKNCFVVSIKQKSVLKTSPREIFDKKIIFKCQEALNECDEPAEEMGQGSPEDIYMWVTECANEMLEQNPEVVRINSYFGINLIGKMDNKPAPTSPDQPENRGTYLHCFSQTDVKAGKWLNKVLVNIAAMAAVDYGNSIRKYISENQSKLDRHVQDQEILYNQI